jgi:hypothetical protein
MGWAMPSKSKYTKEGPIVTLNTLEEVLIDHLRDLYLLGYIGMDLARFNPNRVSRRKK